MTQRLHAGKCVNSVKMHPFIYANKESSCIDVGFAVETLVPTLENKWHKPLNLKNQNQTLDGHSVIAQLDEIPEPCHKRVIYVLIL